MPKKTNGVHHAKAVRITDKMIEQSYKDHNDELIDYASRMIKDPVMANDIVADTFLACMERQGSRLTADQLRRYLFTACHNRCINYLMFGKGFKSRREHTIRDPRFLQDYPEVNDQLFRDDIFEEYAQHHPDALQDLPEKKRPVIELLFLHQLTTTEVANKLKMPVEHVWSVKSKSLALLRKWFGLKTLLPIITGFGYWQ